MKKLSSFIVLLGLFTIQASAIEVRVLGPKQKIFYQARINLGSSNSSDLTAGKITIQALEDGVSKNKLTYLGSDSGISKINGLGGELDVISDQEMRAYGWCYDVDGDRSDVMPDQLMVNRNAKMITWMYVYAHYLNGKWVSMCTPAN